MDGRRESCRGVDRAAWNTVGTPGGCLLVNPGVGTQEQELPAPLLPLPKARVCRLARCLQTVLIGQWSSL